MNSYPKNHEQHSEAEQPSFEVVRPDSPAEIDMSDKAELNIYLSGDGESGDDNLNYRLINLGMLPKDPTGWALYEGQRINPKSKFLLIQGSETPDWKSGRGYKGVSEDSSVLTLGRKTDNPLSERFNMTSRMMSREHIAIAMTEEGNIMLEDLNSTNGVSYSFEQPNVDEIEDDTTTSPVEVVAHESLPDLSPEEQPEADLGNPEPTILPELAIEQTPLESAPEPIIEADIEKIEDISTDFEGDEAMLEAGKQEYIRQINGLLEDVKDESNQIVARLQEFTDNSGAIANRMSAVSGQISDELRQLASRIDYGEYTAGDVKNVLDHQDFVSQLYMIRSSVGSEVNEARYIEGSATSIVDTNREVIDMLYSREQQFEAFVEQAGDTEALEGAMSDQAAEDGRNRVNDVNLGVESAIAGIKPILEVANSSLDQVQTVARQLDAIRETIVRHGHVDADEIRRIAASLGVIAEDRSMQRASSTADELIGQLRVSIGRLEA